MKSRSETFSLTPESICKLYVGEDGVGNVLVAQTCDLVPMGLHSGRNSGL